jgi:hypothetical protein
VKKEYTAKEKTEALDAIAKGMVVAEVSRLTGIPVNTLYSWKGKTILPVMSGPHVCKLCGESFETPKGLGGHMSGAHTDKNRRREKSSDPLQRFLATRSDLVEIVRQVVAEEMEKVAASAPQKITVDAFIQMLRELISDNTKMHEELNRQKKLAEDWQVRAGTALEQAQNAIREMNR